MEQYEIKVIPLEGGRGTPKSYKCSSLVLGMVEPNNTVIVDIRGELLNTFVALSRMVSSLMKDYPKETAVALEVALEYAKLSRENGMMN